MLRPALAFSLAFACVVACSPAPAPAPIVVADAPPAPSSSSPAPSTPAPVVVVDASVDADTTTSDDAGTCDEDGAPTFDCKRLVLGQCSAAEYYACPRAAGLPEGVGFRRGAAARIGACLARSSFKPDDTCFKATEACVREAVRATCIDPSTVATCERELASCSGELKTLCAHFLSSLEPKTRANALKDLASQRRNKKSCAFSWDLNGFPFCPFCPFR